MNKTNEENLEMKNNTRSINLQKGHNDMSSKQTTPQELSGILWNAKEILRNDYRLSQYRNVILPFVVLRRLDAELKPKKEIMLKEYKRLHKSDTKLFQTRIKDLTGYDFYNVSEYDFDKLIADPDHLPKNIKEYMRGFSENVLDIFKNFDFETYLTKLKDQDLLYQVVQYFAETPLDMDSVDNHKMGTIYEMLIQTSSEASNEEAGDHFTPREVIRLMVNLLFEPEKGILNTKNLIKRLYDPAAGTGGMLSIAEEYIQQKYPGVKLEVFGQEINDMTYAICKSDMLLKGIDPDRIRFGNSLVPKTDGFLAEKFDYMLSNPPYGVDWKKYQVAIEAEERLGFKGRYGAGLPRTSDGSLLFLMHMMSKMKSSETGSRLAIVFNGSPLFTGEVGTGSNESSIRKWIIENDRLEAIVALPKDLFYNTNIQTYIWIVTNKKSPQRKGKIQLINAESFLQRMKQNVGMKRNEISDDQIQNITKIYHDFKDGAYSKIFGNKDFGYVRITVERPLKRNFQVSEERISRLKQESKFLKLKDIKLKPKEPGQEDILKVLKKLPTKLYKDYDEFSKDLTDTFSHANFKLDASLQKTLEHALSERDETANPVKDNTGNLIPDSDLRDNENIPLKQDIDEYFKKEVLPYVPDAWIDNSTRDKIGYEIPFNKHFYKYTPLRPIKEIDSEIRKLQKEIVEGFDELMK